MLLSEHVHCGAITFKMTERVEQQIYLKFYIKLEHSSMETIWMSQKVVAMGIWWLAASSPQCARSRNTSCAEFLVKHQITEVTQPPTAQILCPATWLFPKLKSPLRGKRFQMVDGIQENTTGQLLTTGRTVWGPKVPTLKGIEASFIFNKCLYFSYYMAGYHLDRPHI